MDERTAVETLNRLVDTYRVRSLWFLRQDYYPETLAERLRALDLIERHGDREAFKEAAALRRWLLQNFSGASAGS